MNHAEVIISTIKAICGAICSASGAIAAFMIKTLPVIQWFGAFVAIVAGVYAIRCYRATMATINKSK
jgi:hypothetical protein